MLKRSRVNLIVSISLAFLTGGVCGAALCSTNGTPPINGDDATPRENISVYDLWQLTNQNRAEPLVLSEQLNKSADAKCKDMAARNYWSHNAPDGTEPWVFIQKQNISYMVAGENLAYNFTTSKEVVGGWMQSPGHRANIVKADYHKVGYAICHSGSYAQNQGLPTTLVVQHFTD